MADLSHDRGYYAGRFAGEPVPAGATTGEGEGMTDEELDRRIGEAGDFSAYHLRALRAVIRDAVAAERDRCARVADETLVLVPYDGDADRQKFALGLVREIAEKIARRIREGGAA